MTKKLVLSIFIFITLIGNISAETPEILINPSSEEYTRLQSGLAGSNITIINRYYKLTVKFAKYAKI